MMEPLPRERGRPLRLRVLVLALFAALLIPFAAGVTILGYHGSNQTLREGVEERQTEATQAGARSLHRVLDGFGNTTRWMATRLEEHLEREDVASTSVKTSLDLLRNGSPPMAAVWLVDQNGTPAQGVGIQLEDPGDAAAGLAWDTAAGSVRWQVDVVDHPYHLVTLLDPQHIVQELDELTIGDRQAHLVSEGGEVLLSPRGAPVGPSLLASDGWTGDAFASARPLDGGVALVVVSDGTHLRHQQAQQVVDALWGNGVLVVLTLVLAALGTQLVVAPLHQVRQAVGKMSAGDLTARATYSGVVQEIRDLTLALNQMARALQKEHAELVALQEDLEEQVEHRTSALRRRNEELDDFAHTVSHDLKAPLRSISLLARLVEMADAGALSAESRQHLEKIHARIGQLEQMIDSLLAYARAGVPQDPPRRVDVDELLEDVLARLPARDGIDLVTETMPVVETYPVLLGQVFQNLIGNAMTHHDKPTGTVRVAAQPSDEWIVFSVEDDGPGIPQSVLDHLYEPFHPSGGATRGHGLGLAIVKRIVQGQDGTVEVAPRPGGGTRVVFTWPRTPPF